MIAQCLAERIGTESLTERELEVLAFVREGWRNRQIAEKLKVAETYCQLPYHELIVKANGK